MIPDHRLLAAGAALAGAGLWMYVAGWRRLHRCSMIRNLPTSRIRSVAMGMAELYGKIRLTAGEPVTSPVRRLACAWWRVTVVRTDESGDGKRRSTSTVLNLTGSVPFHLEDGTGNMPVDPEGAEVHGDPFCDVSLGGMQSAGDDDVHRFLRSKGLWPASATSTFRVREWALLADAGAYILGEVALPGPGEAAERRKRIADRLKALARDPAAQATADTNQDGVIQIEEYDAAKRRVQDDVIAEDLRSGTAAMESAVTIRKPRNGWFLISSGSEKEALARQGWGGWLLAGGIATILGGAYLLVPYL